MFKELNTFMESQNKLYKALEEGMDKEDFGFITIPEKHDGFLIYVKYIWGIATARKVMFPCVTENWTGILVSIGDGSKLIAHDANGKGFEIYDFEEGRHKYLAMIVMLKKDSEAI